jgi:hypothetical protein
MRISYFRQLTFLELELEILLPPCDFDEAGGASVAITRANGFHTPSDRPGLVLNHLKGTFPRTSPFVASPLPKAPPSIRYQGLSTIRFNQFRFLFEVDTDRYGTVSGSD